MADKLPTYTNRDYDYDNADDAFIIRGKHLNEVNDKVNELIDELADSESGLGSLQYEINEQTDGELYVFVLSDANKLVSCVRDGGFQLRIPPNSDVAFPLGTRIRISKSGSTGNANVYAGSGVTINNSEGYVAPAVKSNGVGEVIKINTNIWMFTGDLVNDA